MKKRIITGAVMGAVGIPMLIWAPIIVFIVFAALLSAFATYELLHMFEHPGDNDPDGLAEGKYTPVKFSFISKILTYTLAVYINLSISLPFYFKFQGHDLDIGRILVISMFLMILVVGFLLIFDKSIDMNTGSKMLLTICYVGIGFGAVPVLRMYSKGMLIYIILTACFTDMFAYFFGVALHQKIFKSKPAPIISPKKSWEGCIFGTIFGIVFGSLVFIFYNQLFDDSITGTLFANVCETNSYVAEVILAVVLTLFVSFVGQIGDLVASKLKRDNGIKDYGKIFPGHGGIMDRFDSTLFISVFLIIVFMFLGIILPL